MAIRYPAPLQPGDRIGVTAPSSRVAEVVVDGPTQTTAQCLA